MAPGLQAAASAQPLVLQFVEILVVADLTSTRCTALFHTVPVAVAVPRDPPFELRHMDWLAGSRLHLVDIVVTRGCPSCRSTCSASRPPRVYGYVVFVSFQAVFIHTNVRCRFGPHRVALVTPQFHHWHHADAPEAMDTNFAVHLPVIDRLFGTCYFPDGRWPEAYGISGAPVPDGWLPQLTWPFRRPRPVVH